MKGLKYILFSLVFTFLSFVCMGQKVDITLGGVSGGISSGSTTDTSIVVNLSSGDSVVIDATNLTSQISEQLYASIMNRHYDEVVTVSTTIKSALNGITDASSFKRYLVRIPAGTYTEDSLYVKSWIDVVGAGIDSTIVQSTSILGDDDVFWMQSSWGMLSNMTIRHTRNTGDPGSIKYPIHADAVDTEGSFTDGENATLFFYNLKVEALGTDSKAGFGIGLKSAQRMYIIDCAVSSTSLPGIFCHNTVSAANSASLTVINTNASGTEGILLRNEGSVSNSDFFNILGGSFTGSNFDIQIDNSGAGAGEAYYYISPETAYTTSSIVDATKEIFSPVITIPNSTSPHFALPEGLTFMDNETSFNLGSDRITTLARMGVGTETPAYPMHLLNTSSDIGFFVQQYKTAGNSTAAYFQNSLGTGAGDAVGIYVINSSAKTGRKWGIYNVAPENYFSGDLGLNTESPSRLFHSVSDFGSTNIVDYAGRFSTNIAAEYSPGFGTGIEFSVFETGANERVLGSIEGVVVDSNLASIGADLIFKTAINGVQTEVGGFKSTFLDAKNGFTLNGGGSGFLKYDGTKFTSGTITTGDLPAITLSSITDADGDTKIEVEETPDSDVIRFETAGAYRGEVDSLGQWNFYHPSIDAVAHFESGDIYGGISLADNSTTGNPPSIVAEANAIVMRDGSNVIGLRMNEDSDVEVPLHLKVGTPSTTTPLWQGVFRQSLDAGLLVVATSPTGTSGYRFGDNVSDATVNGGLYYGNTNNDLYLSQTTSNPISMRVGGTDYFTVEGDGDVVVGQVAGDADFDVQVPMEVDTTLADKNGSVGTGGQKLMSTGDGIEWVNDTVYVTITALAMGSSITQTAGTDFTNQVFFVGDAFAGYRIVQTDYAILNSTATSGSLILGCRVLNATNGTSAQNAFSVTFDGTTTEVRETSTSGLTLTADMYIHAEVNTVTAGTLDGTNEGIAVTFTLVR